MSKCLKVAHKPTRIGLLMSKGTSKQRQEREKQNGLANQSRIVNVCCAQVPVSTVVVSDGWKVRTAVTQVVKMLHDARGCSGKAALRHVSLGRVSGLGRKQPMLHLGPFGSKGGLLRSNSFASAVPMNKNRVSGSR